MSKKENPYRGLKKRRDRKLNHITKADFERMMFELKKNKRIALWAKDVKNDHTPTKYIVVEFNLKDAMTLLDFEEMLYREIGVLL